MDLRLRNRNIIVEADVGADWFGIAHACLVEGALVTLLGEHDNRFELLYSRLQGVGTVGRVEPPHHAMASIDTLLDAIEDLSGPVWGAVMVWSDTFASAAQDRRGQGALALALLHRMNRGDGGSLVFLDLETDPDHLPGPSDIAHLISVRRGLSRWLDQAESGVRVNVVLAGGVRTDPSNAVNAAPRLNGAPAMAGFLLSPRGGAVRGEILPFGPGVPSAE